MDRDPASIQALIHARVLRPAKMRVMRGLIMVGLALLVVAVIFAATRRLLRSLTKIAGSGWAHVISNE